MTTSTSSVTFTPASDATSLSSGNYTKTGILNNIFNLIIDMTTTLQVAAAAQANRLTFLTSWQRAYTDAMSQVHTFVQNNGDYSGVSGSGSDAINTRADLNRLNTNLTQTMQNRQSVVSDDAKALQSAINQTNDAVSQQSNLGTAIMQELGTLLSSMFR